MRRAGSALAVAAAALAMAACSGPAAPSPPSSVPSSLPSSSATPSSASPLPSSSAGQAAWLCRPGLDGTPCDIDLDVTAVTSSGRRTLPAQAAPDPSFDCFYVYPTVSTATTRNAPLASAPEIVRVVQAQAVQMQRSCRLFVPLYRQITLQGLVDGGLTDQAARGLAQSDVVGAFREYLDRYSDGRPFLLLGHSQGAMALTTLVQTEIDGDPALRSRLVSAMLIGGGVWLAPGSTTQGTFQNVPPCRSATQTGCVIAYNTYGSTPPASGLFGRTTNARTTLCVNPAALGGGAATLDAIVPVPSKPGALDVAGFASFPGSLRGECRSDASHTWLQVDRTAASALPADALRPGPTPAWGLHRYDITVALGDLVQLAADQGAAMSASAP